MKWYYAAMLTAAVLLGVTGRPASAQNYDCTALDPCSTHSTVPPVIVGTLSGGRVGSGFVVTVLTASNQPVTNRTVVVDFSRTAILPKDVQIYPTYNDCAGGITGISQTTNSNGQVVFDAAFTGFTNSNLVDVYAASYRGPLILLASIKARSTDCVTSAGPGGTESTGLGDYTYFIDKYLYHPSTQETDFDLDGSTGLADYTIWSAHYGESGQLCRP